jgi:hypothetical protein
MYQASGPLNASYNVRKKGFDIWAIGKQYNADLAWVAIQVIPELQTFNAYFGTIDQIQELKERFSIPMKPDEIRDHGYERLGVEDEFDSSIPPNGRMVDIPHIAPAIDPKTLQASYLS